MASAMARAPNYSSAPQQVHVIGEYTCTTRPCDVRVIEPTPSLPPSPLPASPPPTFFSVQELCPCGIHHRISASCSGRLTRVRLVGNHHTNVKFLRYYSDMYMYLPVPLRSCVVQQWPAGSGECVGTAGGVGCGGRGQSAHCLAGE